MSTTEVTAPGGNRLAQLEALFAVAREWATDYIGLEPTTQTSHGRLVRAIREVESEGRGRA